MTGLLLKDILGLRRYLKQLGASLILFGLLSIGFKSSSYLMGMLVLMSSATVLTSMTYDEMAKWDKYALSMPLSKRDLVCSKYLLLIIITISTGLLSGVLAFFMDIYFKNSEPLQVFIIAGAICLAALFFYSLILPIAFKLGVEKSRIFLGVIFGIPAILVIALSNLGEKYNVPIPTEDQIKPVLYALPFIVIGILYVSYRISIGIMQKKEF